MFLVTQAVRRWDVLLATLVSMAVLVAAAWVAVSRRGPKRVAAIGVVVVALAAFVVVVVASESVRVLVVALVLAGAAVAATRASLPAESTTRAAEPQRAPRATHPTLIMNLRSGGGKAERFALAERCRERGIEPVVLTPGIGSAGAGRGAVARGADVLGMAGGDGSQALVASVAAQHGLPFVVVPAGTRNHFALDLGIDRDDVVGALDAFTDGVVRTVDLAEVNGRVFVNNASMGVYAEVVQSDAYRDAKLHTTVAMLPDLVGPDATPLDLRFERPDGTQASTAQLLLVSNNPYRLGGFRDGFTRSHLDDGVLGVVSLVVTSIPDVQAFTALEAVGQGARFSGLDEWSPVEFEVGSSGPIDIGVDGEALTLEPPLRFRSRPRALTIHLPLAAAAGAGAAPVVHISSRDTIAALWRTALGRPVAP